MDSRLVRGEPRTFSAWVVDLPGIKMLFCFSNRKDAECFLRLVGKPATYSERKALHLYSALIMRQPSTSKEYHAW